VLTFEQGAAMYDAMKSARKEVELVRLRDESRSLSRSATRLQMLQATMDFLRRHNPVD